MKTVIVIALVLVLASLAGAGLFMLRKGGNTSSRDGRMARALALRVGLSMLAEVDQHDPSGPALATAPRQAPAQSTTAFAGADQAAQARIARIIADNLGKDRS